MSNKNKDKIKQMSFRDSVEQVKNASQEYLGQELDKGQKAFASLLYVVGAGGLEIRNKETDKWQSAANNNLPAAFYVSGGGRMIFEFDNVLSPENKEFFQKMYEGYDERPRETSTHRLVKEGNGVKEIKTNGVGDLLTRSKNHFGLDLNIQEGNDHGHMYIGKFDDGMMVGIENVGPGESGHEWWRFGASNDVSAFGVEKFRIQEVKQKFAGETEYQNVIIPGKYNSMKVKVTNELVEGLKEFQQKLANNNIDKDLGSKLPAEGVQSFESSKTHQAPQPQPPEKPKEPNKPELYNLKKFVNIASKVLLVGFIIKPFQKELKTYGEEKKVFKAYTAVKTGYDQAAESAQNSKGSQGHTITPQLQGQAQGIMEKGIKDAGLTAQQLEQSNQKSHKESQIRTP